MIACMGGWCHKREVCQHYRPGVSPVLKPVLIERVCEPETNSNFQPKWWEVRNERTEVVGSLP